MDDQLDGLPDDVVEKPSDEIIGFGGPRGPSKKPEKPVTNNALLGRILKAIVTLPDRFLTGVPLNFTNAGYNVSITGRVVAIYNAKRRYVLIQNKSAVNNIVVGFNTRPSQFNGVEIVAGGAYEPLIATKSTIYAVGIGGSANIVVVEGFK